MRNLAARVVPVQYRRPCLTCQPPVAPAHHHQQQVTQFGALLRDGDEVFRTYFTTARGVDRLRMDFNLLDLTPYGRQEEWEDSPVGWPQDPTMSWLRLHDEY